MRWPANGVTWDKAMSESEFLKKLKDMARRIGGGNAEGLYEDRVVDELLLSRGGRSGSWIEAADDGEAERGAPIDWVRSLDPEAARDVDATPSGDRDTRKADAPSPGTMPEADERPARRRDSRSPDT